jgi:error-prone DNA polymerase
MALMRGALPAGARTARDLRETRHGTNVIVGGMVVARQRPATAGGIVFLLLEDETGMVNVIVRPEVYERHRSAVRADPLLIVRGRLERRERNLNVLAHRVERIEPPREDREPDALPAATAELARARAAVPGGQDFGRGRR